MNTIRKKFANLLPLCRQCTQWLKPAIVAALALTACAAGAQPANDYFTNAFALSGNSGTTSGNNTNATLEACEPNAINTPLYPSDPQTNSVWYKWTAPLSGTVELDTEGSPIEAVLSVWTSTNTNSVPTMCDGSLVNIAADDDSQGAYSQVSFSVVAGTTYYISVASYDDGTPGDNVGPYELNWNGNFPTLPSGPFSFTSTQYVVSESDSSSPNNPADQNTVNPSVLGARITVTRPEPAYGRVLVDYTVGGNMGYTNTFVTNYFGTNIITQIIPTNSSGTWSPPVAILYSNLFSTNIVVTNYSQIYDQGYQTVVKTYTFTNSAIQTYNLAYASSSETTNLVSSPTNFPFLTNYQVTSNSVVGTTSQSFSTNVFGYVQSGRPARGTNFASGSVLTNNGIVYYNYRVLYTNAFTTNYFGTNILLSYQTGTFLASLFTTNYYSTNVLIGLTYSSNSIYTNGLLEFTTNSVGTSWFTNSVTNYLTVSIFNATNYQDNVGRLTQVAPPLTNIWPLANFSFGTNISYDASSNQISTVTNVFGYQLAATNVIPSGNGIIPVSGTVAFNNLQMSADILVPVGVNSGANPFVPNVHGVTSITLSNPRLDPNEDVGQIIPPTIANGTAIINALNPDFTDVQDPAAPNPLPIYASPALPPTGVFNFERSTFRVNKNVSGGNAVISVYRVGGNLTEAVSVDYTIDPDWPNYTAISPRNVDDGILTLVHPANTFPLQAGSDYATPNSDYTPVSGTLSWGAYDPNPKQIVIPILNNGQVEFNADMSIRLQNALPIPTPSDSGMLLGAVNQATMTILFDNTLALGGQPPGQQPAGAVDRSWNKDGYSDSTPQFLNYPGTTPGFDGTVYAVAEQPDGNAIIAGSFISYDSNPYNRIVRVLPNGYQDPTFLVAPNSGANDFIAALALQQDGRIIVGGNFTAFNGFSRYHIARLNTDGSVDTTFNPSLGANDKIWSIALQPNGQIIIGGDFTSYNGTNVNKVARLNIDGSLDTTFNYNPLNPGFGPNGTVDAVALDANQRVIIGGDFDSVAGVTSGAVARLNTDGSLDTTFTPGIGTYNPDTFATDPVKAVAVQTNGQILIGGSFANYNLANYNGLARLNPDGTLDLTFQPGNGTYNPVTGLADAVDAILIQPDGNILIGGNFTAYNQTRRIGLARVFPDGSLDTSFMDTTYNEFAGVPSQYFNTSYEPPTYPYSYARNAIYSIALETNTVTTSDNIIIGGSFPYVGGGFTRDDIHPRSNVARVIGGATPGPGNIELLNNSYSVNNSDGSLYVSLVRTNGNLATASVMFSTNTVAPGAGVASGADFSLSPIYATPTWTTTYSLNPNTEWTTAPGEYGPNFGWILAFTPRPTQADVYITVSNPGNITGNLSANFALSDPGSSFTLGGQNIPVGVALGAQASAPLTIIDSNVKSGVVGFSSPTYTAIENGSSATITLTRTNGSTGSITISYATTDGSATNGIDYTGVTNTLTFGSGSTNVTFNVVTKGHYTSVQPDKTVNLRIFSPSAGTLGLTNATLTLVNPNYTPGHISFSQANYVVNENGGNAVVTVNRLGGSATSLGVTFSIASGTAFNGTNYIGTTTNLFWNTGDATSRTISIPVLDDGVVTPNLTANLQLISSQVNGTNNPEPLTFGGTNATLTIVNVDSAGTFQFSLPTYSVKAYAGYALVPITRTGGSVGNASINFTTLDDTAVHGVNYTTVTNTLTFTNGQVSQVVTVPILSAGTNLTDLFLQLSTNGLNTLAALGSPAKSTLYIIDSTITEPPGSVDTNTFSSFAGFNGDVYSIALQSNNQMVVGGSFTMADGVTRNNIARLNPDGSLDANFSLPSDTYGANGTVRTVAIQADGRILIGGFFTNFNSVARSYVARVNADGTLDSLFNPGSGADNPVYAVAQTFVNGNPMVLLGGSFATVNGKTFNGVGQLNSDGTPDMTFNVGGLGADATVYALAVQNDGKILIGGDFTSYNGAANFNHIARLNANGSVDTNFNVSATGASDSVRAIAVQLDGKILIGGLFTSVNGVPLNHIARLNTDGTVDTTFTPGLGANDSVFSIALQSNGGIVLGGAFTTCSGVTRNRITRLNANGTVDPSINFGTGANDFVGAIAIQQDTIFGYPTNVPDEKIIIGGGFTQYNGSTHQRIARIFGGSIGGSGAFQFSSPYYEVDEKGTNVVITVLRTGGTTNAPTGDVFVTAYTGNGSAVAGTNYIAVNTNLDFPLGEVIKSFVVPVMDDGVVTPNLTVNLNIANPTAPATINQPTALLTIVNDEITISFSQATYSDAKSIPGGVAPISIILAGNTNSTASASFTTTTNGTATVGTDYTPVSQTVTFTPGITNINVDIPVNNNDLAEGNRTVTMAITNVIGATPVNPTNATLTIIDTVTSPGQLFFSATNFSANAADSVAYLTISRTNGTAGLVSVTYSTTPGTALPGLNYVSTTNTVTFIDGQTVATSTVPLLTSTVAQPAVSLTVNLSNPTGGAGLIAPTNTVLTIVNNNAVFGFALATNTVSENASNAIIVVQRSNNTNVISSVNYATVDGTAVAGINYSNTAGTLTFGLGEMFASINVPLINQSNTTTLQFGMNLSSPVNAQLIPPTNTVVLLQGAAAGLSFTTNETTVAEDVGSILMTVVCSNPNVEPPSIGRALPLQVNYATVPGTAKAGIDYQPVSGTLVFTNGLGTNTISVPVFSDPTALGNRTFSVILTGVTAPGYITPYGTNAVVITETNSGVSFSQASYSAFKNSGLATITVNRVGSTNGMLSVDYLATNYTAISGQNFYPTNGTLIFTNGVTSQSFNVALIANTQVQPNLVALLQLSNPTNAFITSPGSATLTILETGGSYVTPAGSQLLTNSSLSDLNNDIIGSNDTVQVLFAFRDGAGQNVTNLVAYLLATNGVTAPSPASQTYGPLNVYGHSVSKPFSFTAKGTNSYTISPTFMLYDNGRFIGPATFTYTLGSWTTTFANTNAIVINDGAAASPYPSIIQVSGLGSSLIKATVTLTNLSDQSLGDVDALVVSPTTNTLIMAHAGGNGIIVNHVTLTLDDAATNSLPQNGVPATGTNKPTQFYPVKNFP